MFSIIIPLYNKESTIYNTIKSVLEQTFKIFELIVKSIQKKENHLGRDGRKQKTISNRIAQYIQNHGFLFYCLPTMWSGYTMFV